MTHLLGGAKQKGFFLEGGYKTKIEHFDCILKLDLAVLNISKVSAHFACFR